MSHTHQGILMTPKWRFYTCTTRRVSWGFASPGDPVEHIACVLYLNSCSTGRSPAPSKNSTKHEKTLNIAARIQAVH